MKRTSYRGFTLVEVMVFSVVSLLLISLLAQFFILASRRTEDSRLRVELQQTAFFIVKKFETDFFRTSARALTALDGPTKVIAWTPVAQWNTNSGVNWEQYQIIYVFNSATKTLHRESYPPATPAYAETLSFNKPYVPTATELEALAAIESGQERVLSTHVEEFSLTDSRGNATQFQTQPLKLQLKLRRKLSTSQRSSQFTVQKRYTLRNSF